MKKTANGTATHCVKTAATIKATYTMPEAVLISRLRIFLMVFVQ